jgi:hypothetical protein
MFALLHDTAAYRKRLQANGFSWTEVTQVPYCLTLPDVYALIISTLLLPMCIVIWCIITVLATPCTIMGSIYLCCIPRPYTRLQDSGFQVLLILCFPFASLIYIIGHFFWTFCYAMSFLLCAPVGLFRLIFLCQKDVLRENFRLLAPYSRDFFAWTMAYGDCARTCLGQLDRHGIWTCLIGTPFMGGFASAVAYIPVTKFLWMANPFLYELQEQFIVQTGAPVPVKATQLELRQMVMDKVCLAKPEDQERKLIDKEWFCPMYPYPPNLGNKREIVVGSQLVNLVPSLFGLMKVTFVQPEDKVRSEASGMPLFLVIFDNSTMHYLTGYVEANITKNGGLEHAMWCIVPKHAKMGRDLWAFINTLFLPYFQQENHLFEIVGSSLHDT